MPSRKDNKFAEDTQRILNALDIAAEYELLGLKITRAEPSPSGWIPAHAFGRTDRNPSAGINVGSGEMRGRYRDHGGEFTSCSLFDFAAMTGEEKDWKEARRQYAKKAGVKLTHGTKAPKDPASQLQMKDWSDGLVAAWCRKKKGITPEAVRMAGGRMASFPNDPKAKQVYPVITLPIFGSDLLDGDPTGWVSWNRTGGTLPVYQGHGKPPIEVKMKTMAGSVSGLMGIAGLKVLDKAEIVIKTAGPTDMMALYSIMPEWDSERVAVITNSGGEGEHPQDWILERLSGKKFYVIGDPDEAGEFGAERWCKAAHGIASECRMVFPDMEKNKNNDLRKWIAEGVTWDQVIERCEKAEVYRPYKPTEPGAYPQPSEEKEEIAAEDFYDDQCLKKLQVDVLGEFEDGKILVFSEYHSKEVVIKDIGRMTQPNFIQAFGHPAKKHIHDADQDLREKGLFRVSEVRDAIANFAGRNRLTPQSMTGMGVWVGLKKEEVEDNSVILVSSKEAAKWNGDGKLHMIKTAREGGRLLGIGEGEKWYDFDRVKDYLENKDSDWDKAVMEQAESLFGEWRWSNGKLDSQNVAYLVLASWIQTLWRFRPHISISGKSNSGKTMLIETLDMLMGKASTRSSKSSAAGLRQAIARTGKIMLCDEFESDSHRKQILEMIRASSRGDSILMGSTHQRGVEFRMRHIFWVAAVETGLHRAPDRNRFIMFELLPAEKGMEGQLQLHDESSLRALGEKMLAVAVRHVLAARALAQELKKTKVSEVDSRLIECYAVPVALRACITGMTRAQAEYELQVAMSPITGVQSKISDEEDLIQAILSYVVHISAGKDITVSNLLQSYDPEAFEALGNAGLTFGGSRPGERPSKLGDAAYVVLDPQKIRRGVLKGSEWEHQAIQQILLRVPGANSSDRRIGGTRVKRAVNIPKEWLLNNYLSEGEGEEEGQEIDESGVF